MHETSVLNGPPLAEKRSSLPRKMEPVVPIPVKDCIPVPPQRGTSKSTSNNIMKSTLAKPSNTGME